MVAHPQRQRMSVDEYLEMERSSEDKHEYINGYVVAMAGGTIGHARLALNMAKLLDEQLMDDQPCQTTTSDVKVYVAADKYFYPDVAVSCNVADFEAGNDSLHTPHLIVEVLSSSTATFDRGEKFACYQEMPSVQEYVLISADRMQVEIFTHKEANMWLYRRFTGGEFILQSLDVTLSMDELYYRVKFDVEN